VERSQYSSWAKGWGIVLCFSDWGKKVFLIEFVPGGPVAHPPSYWTCAEDSFPRDKAARAWSLPVISVQCRG
jgi:hypothetical protein